MNLCGLVKNSFVDFPGKIAAVVFTPGCNYDCYFCHNRHLLTSQGQTLREEELFTFLQARKNLLDGVVISGGEPTLQADLLPFAAKIREMGYEIKLDTNGSAPAVVESLLREGLLSYVAMDVKAPWEKYPAICKADAQGAKETLALLRASGIPFETRTTYLPELTEEDILDIALSIRPVPVYALQEYRVPESYPAQEAARILMERHSAEDFARAEKAAAACGGKVIVRR